jgi:DNA-binding NarL/FixJ family response regulator
MSMRAGFNGEHRSPTIMVADASKMGSQLLADTIQRHNDFRVVGSATTAPEVISGISKLQPDIAVISSRLQDGALTGLQVLRELRTLQTKPRVIMLLDDDRSELVVESFRNGARGIFCRTEVTTGLRRCIHCVHTGQIWANNTQLESIVEALMQAPAPMMTKIAALSKREEEIARLVAFGLSNGEVAQKLSLSRHTVKNYLFRVYEKLGISTRIELVLYILSRYKNTDSAESDGENDNGDEGISLRRVAV